MKTQNIIAAVIVASAFILSACGGGGGNNSPVVATPPADAPNGVPVVLSWNPDAAPPTDGNRYVANLSGVNCPNTYYIGGNETETLLEILCVSGRPTTNAEARSSATHTVRITAQVEDRLPVYLDFGSGEVLYHDTECTSDGYTRHQCRILLAKPEARPQYNEALVEGYTPQKYFQIGVDSNDTPFGFSTDLQDDGFRQLGFVYGDMRVDYMSLPSQLGTVIDSYRIGYTFDDAMYVGFDNYNNGILSTQYKNHTFGAVAGDDGYAIRYEYKITLGE